MLCLRPHAWSLALIAILACAVPPVLAEPRPADDESGLLAQARNAIAQELRQIESVAPPAAAAALRIAAHKTLERHANDPRQLRILAAQLRYLRHEEALALEPFNPPVTDQLRSLTDEILRPLQQGQFGHVPLPAQQQQAAALAFTRSPALPDLVPFFRKPVPSQLEKSLRDNIATRVLDMSKYRKLLLMHCAQSGPDQANLLWEAFIRQSVQDLIVRPIIAHANSRIGQLESDLFGQSPLPAKSSDSAQPPAAPTTRPVANVIDLTRASQERVIGLLLPIVPLLAAPGSPPSTPDLSIHDIHVELKTLYPPFTIVRVRMRLAAADRCWILDVSDVESSDGRTLGEAAIDQTCFIFDPATRLLSRYDPVTRTPAPLLDPAAADITGGVYAWESYRFNDVWKALELIRSAAHAARQPDPSPDNFSLALTAAADGSRRLKLDIPSMHFASRLQPVSSQDVTTAGAIEVRRILFPKGLTLESDCGDHAQPTAKLVAPDRLEAVMTVLTSSRRPLCPDESDQLDPLQLARELLQHDPANLARQIVRQVLLLENAPSDEHCDQLAAQAAQLEQHTSRLPNRLLFNLRDIHIGLLDRLGRAHQAAALFNQQRQLLETIDDPEFARRYCDFYSFLTDRAALGQAAQTRPAGLRSYLVLERCQPHDASDAQPPQPATAFPLSNRPASQPSAPAANLQDMLHRGILAAALPPERSDTLIALLQQMWKEIPALRTVPAQSAAVIDHAWQDALPSLRKEEDLYNFMIQAQTLRWRTYHAALASLCPIPDDARRTHAAQRDALISSLRSIESRLTAKRQFPDVVTQALVAELHRSATLLEREMNSPLNPLCHYPITPAAFPTVITLLNKRINAEVDAFLADYDAQQQACLDQALRAARLDSLSIDFFQNRFRRWTAGRARVIPAYAMGEIFRQYCIMVRKPDYQDPRLFPFARVRGVSVVYRLAEGLNIEIHPLYRESQPNSVSTSSP